LQAAQWGSHRSFPTSGMIAGTAAARSAEKPLRREVIHPAGALIGVTRSMEVTVPRGAAGGLLAFLRRLPPAPDSDDDLLARYARGRDSRPRAPSGSPSDGRGAGGAKEAFAAEAFAALFARHGPMVFAVCRRVLNNDADAEDAVQAVFVALARSAGRLGARDAVAGWLYRVAVRIARKLLARRLLARRRAAGPLPPDVAAPASADAAARELLAALDHEVNALPDQFRAAVVLCGLEGRTNTEAAAILGCPTGTVDSRLHAAKRKLRDRLTRRGFAVPAVTGVLTAAAAETTLAAGPVARMSPVIHSAASGGPLSPAVSRLLQEMTIMRTRFQVLAATVLVLVAAGVGFGLLRSTAAPQPPPAAGEPPGATSPVVNADPPITDADYQDALVAAIHRLAENSWDTHHLRAILDRNPKLVNERVKNRGSPKPSMNDSYTALHWAAGARYGSEKAVELLLRYKADVNADGGLGWTPLHVAAQNGNLEVVKMLVKAGAKVDAKTVPQPGGIPPGSPPGGLGSAAGAPPEPLPAIPALTPLDLAVAARKTDVVEYLKSLK